MDREMESISGRPTHGDARKINSPSLKTHLIGNTSTWKAGELLFHRRDRVSADGQASENRGKSSSALWWRGAGWRPKPTVSSKQPVHRSHISFKAMHSSKTLQQICQIKPLRPVMIPLSSFKSCSLSFHKHRSPNKTWKLYIKMFRWSLLDPYNVLWTSMTTDKQMKTVLYTKMYKLNQCINNCTPNVITSQNTLHLLMKVLTRLQVLVPSINH